jgi:hypothetical protein
MRLARHRGRGVLSWCVGEKRKFGEVGKKWEKSQVDGYIQKLRSGIAGGKSDPNSF